GNLSTDAVATAGPLSLSGPITLGSDVTIDTDAATSDANIALSSTINGGHALTLMAGSGAITLSGAVGGSTRLSTLTATGTTIGLQAVNTIGSQSYSGTTAFNGSLITTRGAVTKTSTA